MALVDPSQAKLLRKDRGTDLTQLCTNLMENQKVLLAMTEYVFCPGRKWRFDLTVWPKDTMRSCVALECQGGVWTRGRHTRGAALLEEWEKLNMAARLSFRIVYCQPIDVRSGIAREIILACL